MSKDNSEKIDSELTKTVNIFKTIYSYPDNQDVTIRNIHINGLNKDGALLFISTITDTKVIDEYVIEPLLKNQDSEVKIDDLVSVPSISKTTAIADICTEVNNGSAVLFVDEETQAYILNASNFESRGIEKPENETVVKGPKEAFIEKASTNISLIRKRIKNENLVVETQTVSKRSNNVAYIVYIKNVTNDDIVDKVKSRLHTMDVDAVQNLSLLEQYIEESHVSIFPTVLNTERPDRAVSFLEDGYVVLLMDNSPDSLVVPATFWSFYHTSEDHYLRLPYGNFTRVLRLFALFVTLFTSALYVAVVTFHVEMIPPDLLLAIASTRELVPFPALFEVLLMEIAFELIREAGLRVPSPIGPTIGIVGALILGQAAVEANIVSPIVVIVVALGGLSSFAIGDISMNFAIRLSRFIFVIAAGVFGMYGMVALFTLGVFYLVSIRTFGVPYLAPMTPTYKSSKDTIFRKMLQNEIFRPGYMKPKDMKKK
ncbi:spore germination protein [Oceanobacillus bengalensis]|uniref:Spore germination protein n=2 Tax=Oceanobacillus bengalensis TaxID=1435466 RepID=A0A494Z0V6_9BACI|nr:spore germination protein [Oceanobacillus bengalensis]